MKKTLTLLTFMAMTVLGMTQNISNMELVANVQYPENCNDIWGYVAPDSSEYAILGTTQATAIHDLSDPSNPVELAYIPGANSTWRDMKHWDDYVYVTTDVGQDGLLIINMSEAPDTITWEYWQPEFDVNGDVGQLERCHNIYIDENGVAYLAGCNIGNRGVIMLDLTTTPGTPIYLGAEDARYSHDAYARGDTLWSSDINQGFFSAWDVSDKANPVELATQTTTMTFTHNAWLSTDGNYLFTTDERGNAYVDSYDVSDLSDIKRLDSYQPADTRGLGVIPHNAHYLDGGFLVVSWYTDGVKVVDVNRPDNMVEVASYDTYDGPDGGFSGCWGVTPYLPSGLVLASDINTGLYVFQPTYVRACYLEGTVRSASTGVMLNEVEVVVESNAINNTTTNAMGAFKAGQAEAGSFDVTFSKAGYETQTVTAELINGEVTMLDIEMQPLPSALVTVQTIEDANGSPIANAKVLLVSETFAYEATTDADGTFTLAEVFFDDYTIYAGAWGYKNILFEQNATVNGDGSYTIALEVGYQDDFILDLGWTEMGNAETGSWERGVPVGTNFGGSMSNPGMDIGEDVGNQCYMTGNGGGGAGTDDVDDGTTVLTSPIMDLSAYANAMVSYNLWFLNDGGSGQANDILEVKITNGTDEVVLETLTSAESAGQWRPTSEFDLGAVITLTDNMQMILTTGDDEPGHLVEAAFDAFLVEGTMSSSVDVAINPAFQIEAFPNPFSTNVQVQYNLDGNANAAVLNVFNMLGQQQETIELNSAEGMIQVGNKLPKGIYFLEIQVDNEVSETLKIVKE